MTRNKKEGGMAPNEDGEASPNDALGFSAPLGLLPWGETFPNGGRGRPSNLPPDLRTFAKEFSWAGWKITTRRDGYAKAIEAIAQTHAGRERERFDALQTVSDLIHKHSANHAATLIKARVDAEVRREWAGKTETEPPKLTALRGLSARTLRKYISAVQKAGRIA